MHEAIVDAEYQANRADNWIPYLQILLEVLKDVGKAENFQKTQKEIKEQLMGATDLAKKMRADMHRALEEADLECPD